MIMKGISFTKMETSSKQDVHKISLLLPMLLGVFSVDILMFFLLALYNDNMSLQSKLSDVTHFCVVTLKNFHTEKCYSKMSNLIYEQSVFSV